MSIKVIIGLIAIVALFAKVALHGSIMYRVEKVFDIANRNQSLRLVLPVIEKIPSEIGWMKIAANVLYVIGVIALLSAPYIPE